MSDPAAVLRPALRDWLRGDADVIAAFGGAEVKIFEKLPPVNSRAPYVFLAGFDVEDDSAECLDATQVVLQIDVWSLTTPPGFAEAEAIAAAIKAAVLGTADNGDSPAFNVTGFRVVAVEPGATRYLTDPSDGKTVHAVIGATLSIDPID